jgi:hypothetical protein
MIRKCAQTCLVFSLSVSLFSQQAAVAPGVVNNPPAPVVTPQAHTILDGTPIKLRLSQTISSADAHVNQEVPFEVIEETKVDDVVVLPKGATAIATVTEAEPKRRMGRGGKLDMSITYARLSDGEKVALRAIKEAKGGGHVGAMTGAIVATSLIIWPAAPFFLFMHGKDITIPQGTEITAFVEGDMHLDMAKFGVPSAPAVPAGVPASQPGFYVESTPSGADIDVDGNFVGSTPSTVYIAAGHHQINVHKKGFTPWTRTIELTVGVTHLSADLEKAN